ncbi:hypothetical protein LZ30DRAFT_399607 [Colletotrichum cereale]|nr:hypothetical protein LZ30DRAFT_399607 [Colletotrichum cereale]
MGATRSRGSVGGLDQRVEGTPIVASRFWFSGQSGRHKRARQIGLSFCIVRGRFWYVYMGFSSSQAPVSAWPYVKVEPPGCKVAWSDKKRTQCMYEYSTSWREDARGSVGCQASKNQYEQRKQHGGCVRTSSPCTSANRRELVTQNRVRDNASKMQTKMPKTSRVH